jgi:hypothetical protein
MIRLVVTARLRQGLAALGGSLSLLAGAGAHAADDAGDPCAALAVNLGLVLNDQAQWAADSQKVSDAAANWYARASEDYAQFKSELVQEVAKFAKEEAVKGPIDYSLEQWVSRTKKDLLAIDETLKMSIAQRGGRKLTQTEAQQLKTLLASKLKTGEVGALAEAYSGAAAAALISGVAELIFDRAVDSWDLYVAASAVDDAQLMQRGLGERQTAVLDRVTALKRQTIGTHCPWPSDFETEWQLASGHGVTPGDPLATLTAKVQSIRHSLETVSSRCAAGVHGEARGPSIEGTGLLGAVVGGVIGAAVGGNTASIGRGIAIGGGVGAGTALAARAKNYMTREPRSGTDAAVCSQLDSERRQIDQSLAGLVNGTECRPDNYASELSCAYQLRATFPTMGVTLQTILKTNQRTCTAIGNTLKPKKPALESARVESERKVLFPTLESIDSCIGP